MLVGCDLYGRDREIARLVDLLVGSIVLLHSPSGAGKTSLIQAKLIPTLEREDFDVLPIIPVGQEPSPTDGATNRYLLSALRSLRGDASDEPAHVESRTGFQEYLDGLFKEEQSQRLVLDQFEEILTADPTDLEAKENSSNNWAWHCEIVAGGRCLPCAKTTWRPSSRTCATFQHASPRRSVWICSTCRARRTQFVVRAGCSRRAVYGRCCRGIVQ